MALIKARAPNYTARPVADPKPTHTYVRRLMQTEARASSRFYHGPHAGQMAAWEDMLADEVGAVAVDLVPAAAEHAIMQICGKRVGIE